MTTKSVTTLACVVGLLGSAAAAAAAPVVGSGPVATPAPPAAQAVDGGVHWGPVVRLDGVHTVDPSQTRALSAAAAASFCMTTQGYRNWESPTNFDLAHYYLRVSWCGNGYSITSHRVERWPEAYFTGVKFNAHIGQGSDGGTGYSSYRYWTQGSFSQCVPGWCFANWYPKIGIRVFGNGYYIRED